MYFIAKKGRKREKVMDMSRFTVSTHNTASGGSLFLERKWVFIQEPHKLSSMN